MKGAAVFDVSSSEVQNELIDSIKKKISRITDGDPSEPVYLKDIRVADPEGDDVTSSRLKLNSIFCNEAGILCGDLVGEVRSFTDGIIFGQSIEDLSIKDLEKIVKALDADSWSVIINGGASARSGFFHRI